MKRYALGLAFTADRDSVLLIRKKRPTWQKGLLNGIGGKIEEGESPAAAMRREAIEEAGVDLEWEEVCTLSGHGFVVHVFRAFNDAVRGFDSKTDELVRLFRVKDVAFHATIRNIPMLLAIARDDSGIAFPIHLSEVAPLPSPAEFDRRVSELLAANNEEVFRRRDLTQEVARLRAELDAAGSR